MGYYSKNPNTYTQNNFIEIPEGNHRVKICNVKVERFRFEKKCFEITLKVSGHHGKLWYYIWYNPKKCHRRNEKMDMKRLVNDLMAPAIGRKVLEYLEDFYI